jgi:hypothetical protein
MVCKAETHPGLQAVHKTARNVRQELGQTAQYKAVVQHTGSVVSLGPTPTQGNLATELCRANGLQFRTKSATKAAVR